MATSIDIEVNISTDNGAVLKTGLMYKQGKPTDKLVDDAICTSFVDYTNIMIIS